MVNITDKNNPLVSIIIPVYNREKYIDKAIDSSLGQTYKNIEIVIVDNQSTDNTWQIIKTWATKDKRIRVFQNESNIGPVRNWKRCIDEAKGKYVKILWSDDWMDESFIDKAISLMNPYTAFVLSYCEIINDKDGQVIGRYSFKNNSYSSEEYLDDIIFNRFHNFPVSPGCALFRTEDIRSAYIEKVPNKEGLDSSINGAGNDMLMYLETALKYKSISIIPDVLNYFRAHDDSISVATPITKYYEWARIYFMENNLYHFNRRSILKFWIKRDSTYNGNEYNTLLKQIKIYPTYNWPFLHFWTLLCSKNSKIKREKYGQIKNNKLFVMVCFLVTAFKIKILRYN